MEYATMSIASFGASTLPDAKRTSGPFAVKKLTDNSDIDGSYATNKFDMFSTKYQKSLQDEVAGSKPLPRTRTRNSADLQLEVDDIDGARVTRVKGIYASKRHLDPLSPDYSLPSYSKADPPASSKSVRDTLFHSDIDGTHTKPLYKAYTRDIIGVSDIEGTNAQWRARNGRPKLSQDIAYGMSTSSETKVDDPTAQLTTERSTCVPFNKRTHRATDPVDPTYECYGQVIQNDPQFTKPKRPKEFIPDNRQLQTADIPFASATWKVQKESERRRDFRATNFIGDIEGAQHDTAAKSIRTSRSVHPLQPVYQSLDGSGELLEPCIAPLVPAILVGTPTLRMGKGAVTSNSSINSNRTPQSDGKNSRIIGSGGLNSLSSFNSMSSNQLQSPQSSKPATASGFGTSSVSFATKFDDFKSNQTGAFGGMFGSQADFSFDMFSPGSAPSLSFSPKLNAPAASSLFSSASSPALGIVAASDTAQRKPSQFNPLTLSLATSQSQSQSLSSAPSAPSPLMKREQRQLFDDIQAVRQLH